MNNLQKLLTLVILVLVVVAVRGLRRLSVRRFQTAIEMDGANCLKADDGSVVFRRFSGDTLLIVLVLAVFELALLYLTVLVVTVGHWTLLLLVGLLIGCFLIGLALFSVVRSLRQPYIYVNANSRTMECGTQQIPFSRILNICATPRPRRTQSSLGKLVDVVGGTIIYGVPVFNPDYDKTYIDIGVTLDDGGVIRLGSVSGFGENSVRSRAATITILVAEVTGAAIREPVETPIR